MYIAKKNNNMCNLVVYEMRCEIIKMFESHRLKITYPEEVDNRTSNFDLKSVLCFALLKNYLLVLKDVKIY